MRVCLALLLALVPALAWGQTGRRGVVQKDLLQYEVPFVLLNGHVVGLLTTSSFGVERIGNLSAHPDIAAIGVFFPPSAPPQRLWELTPQIAELTQLGVLFTQAAIDGSIPTQVGLLSELQTIVVLDNPHLGGRLPSQLGQLTELIHLEIYSNGLHGQVPTQLGLLTKLTALDFEGDGLWGAIPSELGRLSQLTHIVARKNSLEGPLPSELALVPTSFVAVESNQLSGPLPSQLACWTGLTKLIAWGNQLTGELPFHLGVPAGLDELVLADNHLSGTIPSQLALASHLKFLVLDSNQFDGTFPRELCAHTILEMLTLSHNSLTGDLPSQLALLRNLTTLEVAHNDFASFPTQIGAISGLQTLRLSGNPLGERLPTELGALAALRVLEVAECRLRGTIPSQLGALLELESLALNGNGLRGTVPSQLARLARLTAVLLHSNQLSGTLPRQLSSLVALETVWVANNALHGKVPAPVWEQHCANSGLDSHHCEYPCGKCSGSWVQLRRCDWKGRGQWCVPWAAVGPFCALCIVVVASVYFKLLGQGKRKTVYLTARTSFSLLDTTTDFLFAVNNSGWVGDMALSSWVVVWIVKVVHAARTMRRRGCVAGVHGKARWALVCAISSVDAAALHEAVDMDDHSLGMSLSIVLLSLGESLLAGSLQLSVVMGEPTGTITWTAFVMSACNVVALSTIATIMALSRYHSKQCANKRGRELSSSTQQSLVVPNTHRPETRRRLAALFCCCALAGVAVFSPTTEQPNSASLRVPGQPLGTGVDVGGSVEVPFPVQVPRSQVPRQRRSPSQRGLVHKSSLCSGAAGVSIEMPYICVFGQLAMFVDLGQAPHSLETLVQQGPYLLVLIAEFTEMPLPPGIGQLSNLASLAVARAAGLMPSQIGLLSKLQFLDYSHTAYPPLVSQIGLLTSLQFLRFRECSHRDTVLPSEIAQLSALTIFEYFRGHLRAGTLASWIGQLTALQTLLLADNSLEGTMPSQLGRLANLTIVALQGNELSGTLPSQLALLTKLTMLSIHGSSLEGSILPSLLDAQIGLFDVQDNRLAGTLPPLPEATCATVLNVRGNALTGTIPSQIGRASKLTELFMDANRFSGTLPTQLALLTLLTALALGSNELKGTVPAQLAALTALQVVDLANNQLWGVLPSSFSASQRKVWLGSCDWSGLDEAACKRECPLCPLGTVELKGCNSNGYHQLCAPLYLVMITIGLVAVAMRLVLRALSRRKSSHKSLAWASVMSTLAAVHMLLDVLFARTARRTLAILASVAIGVAIVSRLVLVANEFVRLEKQGKLEKIQEQYKRFAIAVVLCVVDPPTLLWIAHTGSRRRLLLVRARVFASMVLPDLVLLGAQAAAVSESGSSLALQALFASGLSVAAALWLWHPGEMRSMARVSVRPPRERASLRSPRPEQA